MIHEKILLVDDDLDDQVIFLDALSEIATQAVCITADSGIEVFTNLKTMAPLPSIIFLDLNMPFMNGFECLERIKKDEQYKKIPVIIFTTSNNPADKIRAKELGAELFFTKTADFKLLKSTLLNILTTDFSAFSAESYSRLSEFLMPG